MHHYFVRDFCSYFRNHVVKLLSCLLFGFFYLFLLPVSAASAQEVQGFPSIFGGSNQPPVVDICPEGTKLENGFCTFTILTCPVNQVMVDGNCKSLELETDHATVCFSGMVYKDHKCQCPVSGEVWFNGKCQAPLDEKKIKPIYPKISPVMLR